MRMSRQRAVNSGITIPVSGDKMATIGLLPLGRPTFDVPYAEELLEAALLQLDQSGHRITGARSLLMDADATSRALEELADDEPDLSLILQVTFTDAAMTAKIAETLQGPLAIWAFPEPRLGGRLRLNAFCGLNLAAHALGLRDRPFSWLYRTPGEPGFDAALNDLLTGSGETRPIPPKSSQGLQNARAKNLVHKLRGARIGRIGQHPDGFDTCAYNDNKLSTLAQVSVSEIALPDLFERAQAASQQNVADVRKDAEDAVSGLDRVDQEQLDKSLRLKVALEDIRQSGGFDAFAIRCWPETFTEYGGAVCGPVSMMAEKKVPCACEADVYGALTSLIVQEIAGEPAFLVDLVDIDTADGTGVVWHCGQAPISMADPDAARAATIHTNRKMPLLYEFPLKPGRVTLARVSQARDEVKMVVSAGAMEKRQKAFTGTSGVLTFDTPPETVMQRIMDAGLEHHMALIYGDHRATLASVAAELNIPILEI